MCDSFAGQNTSPQPRGPFGKFASLKTRSGELPRRQSLSLGKDAPISPQGSGGSLPQPQQTPFSHSNTWGSRAGPSMGAVASALASASSNPVVGSRGAHPAGSIQQPGEELYGQQQVTRPTRF